MKINQCLICVHGGKPNQFNKVECAEKKQSFSILTPMDCEKFSQDRIKTEALLVNQIANIASLYAAGGDLGEFIMKIEERISLLGEMME